MVQVTSAWREDLGEHRFRWAPEGASISKRQHWLTTLL